MGAVTAVGAAVWAAQNGWGILNRVELAPALSVIIALIVLDLAIYFQHWAVHKIPLLWRFHRIHHADRDFDVTTALRFHPVEIVFSMLYKCAWVLVLGPTVWAVVIFEIVLNGTAMFNHANLKLPLSVDRVLRVFIVTPDMHRVHHSIVPNETHSNFGFNLSVWDRLFRTYRAQPDAGHRDMVIGLPDHQNSDPVGLSWTLFSPFRRD